MSRAMTNKLTTRTLFGTALAAATAALAVIATPATGNNAASVTKGDKAPNFTLTDTDGKEHSLADYTKEGKVVVLEWFNPDCPFVKKFHSGSTYARDVHENISGDDVV